MRSTGIVRKLDELGRIVIPVETRRTLGLKEKDPVEIFVDGDQIILRSYSAHCCICGNNDQDGTMQVEGKQICKKCAGEIAKRKGWEK